MAAEIAAVNAIDENEEHDNENSGRRHIFFQRSESTLCLGKVIL